MFRLCFRCVPSASLLALVLSGGLIGCGGADDPDIASGTRTSAEADGGAGSVTRGTSDGGSDASLSFSSADAGHSPGDGGAVLHPGSDASAAPHEGSVTGLLLGAYADGFGDTVPSTVGDYVTLVGVRPQIVMWYQDWVHTQDFNAALMDSNTAGASIAEITWEPHDWDGDANQPAFSLTNISAGNYDTYIHTFAKASAAYGKPFFLRFMHEMQGGWYSWSPDINGNTPALYVATWKHVVDIFRAEGATNVRWMWTPNVDDGGFTAMSQFYPGDDYVDWIGLDGYNTGTAESWSTWQSLYDVFKSSYDQIAAVSATKPMILAETASDDAGGDKPGWITDGFLTTIPQSFPRVKIATWFDVNKEHDWRVNSSSATLTAWKSVCSSQTWAGSIKF